MSPELYSEYNSEKIQVRGYTSFNRPASLPLKRLAGFTDICFILLLVELAFKYSKMSPTPGVGLFCFLLPLGAAYWIPQKLLLGTTFGERLWQLKPKGDGHYRLRETLYQRDKVSVLRVFVGSLVATFFALLTVSTFDETILQHPFWLSMPRWNLAPFSPPTIDWVETPFSTPSVAGQKRLTVVLFFTLSRMKKLLPTTLWVTLSLTGRHPTLR